MRRATMDTPRDRLEPPAMTAHAEAVLVDLRDELDDEVWNDTQERFALWVMRTKSRRDIEGRCGTPTNPVRRHGAGYERYVRRSGQRGGHWMPLDPRYVWTEFCDRNGWIEEFVEAVLSGDE